MFFEVIHNMLNGQKLTTAIKSVFERQALEKKLPQNLQKYQSALDNKIGYYIEEWEFSNEYSLHITIMEQAKIISYSIQEKQPEGFDFPEEPYFKSQKTLANLNPNDSFFNQEISRKVWLLENGKINLFENGNNAILNLIKEDLKKEWKGRYNSFDIFLEEITNDIAHIKF